MIALKDGINLEVKKGKFITYSELIAENGYCFYDKTLSENERIYHTNLKSPIIDSITLKNKYELVKGDADFLNEEVIKKIEQEMKEEVLNV